MQIQKDNYRYLNWVLFFFASLINSFPTQAFAAITPTIVKVYDISQTESAIPSMLFPISYVFLFVPVNYILDKKGLKMGTTICEVCMIAGLSVRLMINLHIYLFFLGTFLCSLGFCFMISGAVKFANLWFPSQQISLVNATCLFAIFGSDAIGTWLSSFFIKDDATKQTVFEFFLWQSIIMIVIQASMLFLFRGRPNHIQNYASDVKRNSFKEDLKHLIRHRNYMTIFLAQTFIFGDLTIMFVFVPWISKAYNFNQNINGTIFLIANLLGCIGCVLFGLLNKRITYRLRCITLSLGFIAGMGLLWLSFEQNWQAFAYVCGGIIGFFCYPLLTTMIDFATQTTFPVGEATAGGILLFGGQFFGVVLTLIFSTIFDGDSISKTRILLGIMVLLVFLGMTVLSLAKESLKRDEYQELKQSEKGESILSVHQTGVLDS